VRTIFTEFLRLGNVTFLRDWMRDNKIRSKEGNHLEIRMNLSSLIASIASKMRTVAGDQISAQEKPQITSIEVAFRHIPIGKTLRLVVNENQPIPESSRLAMLKAKARARLWYEQLVLGDVGSLRDLSRLRKISIQYVKHIFRLAFLSPASIESILNHKAGPELTLNQLFDRAHLEWSRQTV
jgi:hypothetical protein